MAIPGEVQEEEISEREPSGGGESTSYLGKVVLLVEGLAGREYEPMTLDEMTKKSGFDKASVLRILQGLEALGWAEQKEKSWRLAPRFIRMSETYRLGRDRFFRKLDETDRNYLVRM